MFPERESLTAIEALLCGYITIPFSDEEEYPPTCCPKHARFDGCKGVLARIIYAY
jgi:hypothetical protein